MPANYENVRSISRLAGADFSGGIQGANAGIYRFVKLNTTAIALDNGDQIAPGAGVILAGNGDRCIGVLSGKQIKGHAISVDFSGRTKVVCGAAVTAGDKVQSDANGAAIPQASTGCVQGEAFESGAAGEVISVLLDAQGAP
jgi:hypothetical protein